jgi:hypothetical protein
MAQVVRCLSGNYKTLSSSPSPSKKQANKKTQERKKHGDLGFLALPYVVFPPYCNNSTC